MARMRPVLFSSTTTAPCTIGRTRSSARAPALPLPSVTRTKHHVVERELALGDCVVDARAAGCGRRPSPTRHASPFLPPPASPPRRPASSARRRAAAARSRAPAARPAACRRLFAPPRARWTALARFASGATELHPAGAALVARKPFLQRRLDRALQWRVDGRAHRVGVGRDRLDAGHRLGLARDLIDEMEADVAARPLVGDHRRQRRQPAADLLLRGITPSSCMRLST